MALERELVNRRAYLAQLLATAHRPAEQRGAPAAAPDRRNRGGAEGKPAPA